MEENRLFKVLAIFFVGLPLIIYFAVGIGIIGINQWGYVHEYPPIPEGPPIHIGVMMSEFNNNTLTFYRSELQKYIDELNETGSRIVEFLVVDGANDVNTQTEQALTFIAEGVDGLIVDLANLDNEKVIKAIEESNIPCVYINHEIPDYSYTDQTCFVWSDRKQIGTLQGQIVSELKDKGDINHNGTLDYLMINGDMKDLEAQLITESSIKALEDAGIKLNKLYEQTGNWDQAQGQEIAAEQLAIFKDQIDVILCNNDAMAFGAYQAIQEAGRTVGKDIYLLGIGAISEAVEMVQEGTMTGTVYDDIPKIVDVSMNLLLGLLEENPPKDKVNYIDYKKVTKENVNDFKTYHSNIYYVIS